MEFAYFVEFVVRQLDYDVMWIGAVSVTLETTDGRLGGGVYVTLHYRQWSQTDCACRFRAVIFLLPICLTTLDFPLTFIRICTKTAHHKIWRIAADFRDAFDQRWWTSKGVVVRHTPQTVVTCCLCLPRLLPRLFRG